MYIAVFGVAQLWGTSSQGSRVSLEHLLLSRNPSHRGPVSVWSLEVPNGTEQAELANPRAPTGIPYARSSLSAGQQDRILLTASSSRRYLVDSWGTC